MSVTELIHIESERTEAKQEKPESIYESAAPIDAPLDVKYGRDAGRFVNAVLGELEKDEVIGAGRLVDEIDTTETDDVDLGVLLAYPDESILFIGSDPTARDSIPLFGFVIERHQPIPTPTTAQDALDLLKPDEIRQAFETEGELPARQGEWWLLPTRAMPVGTVFQPGVNERPFGPSPLGNHVPREYGFAVTDRQFIHRFHEAVPHAPTSIETPPEVIDWAHRQLQKTPVPDHAPSWGDIRELADRIYVRGTLRHRENDHYVENAGEQWHEAQTHDMDVYTGDDYLERVRID